MDILCLIYISHRRRDIPQVHLFPFFFQTMCRLNHKYWGHFGTVVSVSDLSLNGCWFDYKPQFRFLIPWKSDLLAFSSIHPPLEWVPYYTYNRKSSFFPDYELNTTFHLLRKRIEPNLSLYHKRLLLLFRVRERKCCVSFKDGMRDKPKRSARWG